MLAILDWELSTLGHPLADLAYSAMPYHFPSGFEALPSLGATLPEGEGRFQPTALVAPPQTAEQALLRSLTLRAESPLTGRLAPHKEHRSSANDDARQSAFLCLLSIRIHTALVLATLGKRTLP